jgi:uncharacterized protein DUF3788
MAPSEFLDREAPPDAADLARVLGSASAHWEALLATIAREHGPIEEKWSWSGKSHGWLLRVTRRKTTIVYLIPGSGSFVASFALRDAALDAARGCGLTKAALARLDDAPKFAEGRAVKLEVRSKRDLADVEKLAAIKASS